jgi:hypothetical protein
MGNILEPELSLRRHCNQSSLPTDSPHSVGAPPPCVPCGARGCSRLEVALSPANWPPNFNISAHLHLSTPTTTHTHVEHLRWIHQWQLERFHLIDWTLYDSITNKKSSFLNCLFQIRWANHILPLQQRQFRFQLTPSAGCPSECGCLKETDTHLLQCPHPEYNSSPFGLHTTSIPLNHGYARFFPRSLLLPWTPPSLTI